LRRAHRRSRGGRGGLPCRSHRRSVRNRCVHRFNANTDSNSWLQAGPFEQVICLLGRTLGVTARGEPVALNMIGAAALLAVARRVLGADWKALLYVGAGATGLGVISGAARLRTRPAPPACVSNEAGARHAATPYASGARLDRRYDPCRWHGPTGSASPGASSTP
jgi:hypothetical protein